MSNGIKIQSIEETRTTANWPNLYKNRLTRQCTKIIRIASR
ncbi:hypothetical protein RRSWK_03674 [Rhodopirellula sp. SWK7]|nr:hypothetical protein RRSWK_03674 [Rhodopirellula sp. SWK7]